MKKKKYIHIPLRLNVVGHLELDVKIDGVKTIFLLDTGASNTVVDIGFAKENVMEFSSMGELGGGVGTSELSIFHRKINLFTVGDFKISSFDLYATDFQHVKASLEKKGITQTCNGVIGADILIKYQAKINYKKMRLYLKQQ